MWQNLIDKRNQWINRARNYADIYARRNVKKAIDLPAVLMRCQSQHSCVISRSLVQICYSLQLKLELELLANHWGSIRIGSQHTYSQKLQYHAVCLDVMACHSDLLLSSLLANALVSLIIVEISRLLSRRRTVLLWFPIPNALLCYTTT